jgi:hypothetical protein
MHEQRRVSERSRGRVACTDRPARPASASREKSATLPDVKVGRGSVVVVTWLLLGSAIGACNAITGQHERTLADDSSSLPGRDGGGGTDTKVLDDQRVADEGEAAVLLPDQDAPTGPITITVPQSWSSPNGAVFTTNASGTTITDYGRPPTFIGHHPLLVPSPAINIPTEDYTVEATIFAPTSYEFGVMVRRQPDGNGIVYGSIYAGVTPAFLGKLGPNCCPVGPPTPADPWNPTKEGTGPNYTLVAGTRYIMKVRAVGNQITAKLWVATGAEPLEWHASMISPWSTGRGIGFYEYFTGTSGFPVLEAMKVTTIP